MRTYWIGTQPNPDDRMIIDVSDADAAKLAALPRNALARTEVVNRKNGEVLKIRRASCGAPHCLCALVVVPEVRR